VLSFWHALQLLQNIDSTNPFGNLESHLFCHKLYIWSLHLPFTFSILYHDRVAKHLNFSCGLHLCNFHLSFSKTTPCLLQATSLGTFVSMHNFAQRNGTTSIFYQVFSSLSCGTSSRAIQLGKIFYYFLVNMDSVWLDTFPSVGDSRKCCNRPLTPDICNKRNMWFITSGTPIHTKLLQKHGGFIKFIHGSTTNVYTTSPCS